MTDARLAPGDLAPDFTLSDQDGREVTLSSLRGSRVVLYFYPEAMTPGCTTEACDFRDSLNSFVSADVRVVGVSKDPVDKLKRFAERDRLNFTLLSDPEHKTAEKYGTWGEKKLYGKAYMGIIRSAFLIDEKGKVAEAWYKVSPKDTPKNLLKALG